MSSGKFAPLFWCQFFSAFNDNILKNGLIALIVFGLGAERSATLVQLAGAILILPFFFLSGLGGQIADRYDKALVTQRLKLTEIAVAALGAVGFMMQSIPILMATLGGFGIIAALFGPIKYGILPDHLETPEIPAGNALIEGATFIAILTATVIGTKIAASDRSGIAIALLMLGIAALCWLTSLRIPRTGEAAPGLVIERNIFASTIRLIRDLYGERRLWRGTLAVSWFWLFGAVVLSLLATFVKNRLGGTEDLYIACMLLFSVSIGVGSMLAAYLSHGRIFLPPAAAGALLMSVFTLDLGLSSLFAASVPIGLPPLVFFGTMFGAHLGLDLVGLSLGGGLFIVPIFAAVQIWAGEDRRARVIAGNNIVNAAFIVGGALTAGALQAVLGMSEPQVFVLLGLATLVVAAWTYRFVLPLNTRARHDIERDLMP